MNYRHHVLCIAYSKPICNGAWSAHRHTHKHTYTHMLKCLVIVAVAVTCEASCFLCSIFAGA